MKNFFGDKAGRFGVKGLGTPKGAGFEGVGL